MSSPAFYSVANRDYFLGAVGLVNSLRLVGHRELIYLLDCGLVLNQRELLEPEALATRRQPYLSAAAILVERSPLGIEVLALMEDRQTEVNFDLTHWRRNVAGCASTYADQDVLNAILATRVEPDRIVALEERLAPVPPFTGLRVLDEGTLYCAYDDGVEPSMVHHYTAKPWLEPTHHGVCSQLLRRLLIGDDVVIKVPEAEIPLRLRRGLRAYAERKRVNARERFRYHVREPLAARLKGTRG